MYIVYGFECKSIEQTRWISLCKSWWWILRKHLIYALLYFSWSKNIVRVRIIYTHLPSGCISYKVGLCMHAHWHCTQAHINICIIIKTQMRHIHSRAESGVLRKANRCLQSSSVQQLCFNVIEAQWILIDVLIVWTANISKKFVLQFYNQTYIGFMTL